jgi:hypothetical protein
MKKIEFSGRCWEVNTPPLHEWCCAPLHLSIWYIYKIIIIIIIYLHKYKWCERRYKTLILSRISPKIESEFRTVDFYRHHSWRGGVFTSQHLPLNSIFFIYLFIHPFTTIPILHITTILYLFIKFIDEYHLSTCIYVNLTQISRKMKFKNIYYIRKVLLPFLLIFLLLS